jgi:hypothetical protein
MTTHLVSVPRELLERVAYEHTDTNKFARARQELHAVLREPAETRADVMQEFHNIDDVASLRRIIAAYDAYRGRGVAPAPGEYQGLVDAINAARRADEHAGDSK